MGNYSFTLFRVSHNYNIYPIWLWNALTDAEYQVENESDFLRIISLIFNSNEVKNAINAIIANSK
jgi:hypothetical protein